MRPSVIVTAYRSADTLRAYVEQLQRDPDVVEILVADCSEETQPLPVAARRFPTPTAVPVMRWAMLKDMANQVVACLKGRCVLPTGWGGAILGAHEQWLEAHGIGGGLRLTALRASRIRWLDFASMQRMSLCQMLQGRR